MTNKIVLLFVLSSLFIASCTIENIEPDDMAGEIIGTYIMETYETHTGESTPNSNDKIVITRTNNTIVDVAIDYALTGEGNDISFDEMSIVESNGIYQLDKTFFNAEASVDIDGNSLFLQVDYTNGNFATITASK